MSHYIIAFFTTIIVGIIFQSFKRNLPVNATNTLKYSSLEALHKKYFKIDILEIVLLLLFAAGLLYFFIQFFKFIIEVKRSAYSESEIIVSPKRSMIFLISLFSSLLTAAWLVFFSLKKYLKSKWEEYLAYKSMNYGFDYFKASKYTIGFIAVLTGITTIGVLDWHSAFAKDEIKINGFFSFGDRTYQYDEIKKVKDVKQFIAPNGKMVLQPHYIIEFNDGYKWNSRDQGFANYLKNKEIAILVINKSDLELIELEFDD